MGIKEAAFLLGMIGFSQFMPLFLLTPITGLVADTFDRRWIVRFTTMCCCSRPPRRWGI